jgi:ABC-type spermidine/putrescine transport system permease subunit II
VSRRISIPWLAITSALLLLFLYAPLLIAGLYAFNDGRNLTWPPHGFSLRWFQNIIDDPTFRSALVSSVVAATTTAIIATSVATAACFAFVRARNRGSRAVEGLGRLPVMLPPVFVGVGFVALMQATRSAPSMLTVIAGHVTVALPWAILVIGARLRTMEPEVELASRDLGAGPWQTMRRITLPIIAPAIFGAALLAFAWSFDELLITNFTSGQITTVPIYVLAKLRRLYDPSANAVALVLLALPWVTFGVAAVFLRRSGGNIGELLGQRIK